MFLVKNDVVGHAGINAIKKNTMETGVAVCENCTDAFRNPDEAIQHQARDLSKNQPQANGRISPLV